MTVKTPQARTFLFNRNNRVHFERLKKETVKQIRLTSTKAMHLSDEGLIDVFWEWLEETKKEKWAIDKISLCEFTEWAWLEPIDGMSLGYARKYLGDEYKLG